MRTGPFSDPVVVTLINRYFVPYHLDNRDGTGVRYGMEPGHEDAYIILETPELAGGPAVETTILGNVEGLRGPEAAKATHVLEPDNARRALRSFLAQHRDLYHPWPELIELERNTDAASRMKYAELLLDEGEIERATAVIDELEETPEAALLEARAYRMGSDWSGASATLERAGSGAEIDLERIRLAYAQGDRPRASRLLDAFLANRAESSGAGEAFYLRGWLHHRAGEDQQALDVWQRGLALHPPDTSLFSQKSHLTLIRKNWSIEGLTTEP